MSLFLLPLPVCEAEPSTLSLSTPALAADRYLRARLARVENHAPLAIQLGLSSSGTVLSLSYVSIARYAVEAARGPAPAHLS